LSWFSFDAVPDAVRTEAELRSFLEALDRRLEAIGAARARLDWSRKRGEPYDGPPPEAIDAALDDVYSELHHDRLRRGRDLASDPLLRRSVHVLDNAFTLARIDQGNELRCALREIADLYMSWRPTLDGDDLSYTRMTAILRGEPDRGLRQRAWESVAALGALLDAPTREMFYLRNDAARALGHATYGDLRLKIDGVTREWLTGLVHQMETTTGPEYASYLRSQADAAGIEAVEPWDVQYLYDRDPWPRAELFPADRLIDNTLNCAEALCLPARELGIRIFWYDSPYGGEWTRITQDDLRILTNRGDGLIYYHTAYHEYGHALHDWHNHQPYSLRRESSMFSEGMAQLWALFVHYPSWLRRSGVPDDEIARYRRTRRLPWMYRHRRICTDVLAELAVWDDPSANLDEVYGRTTARFLGCAAWPRPFAATPRWVRAMQMQSYFIADLISTQTHAYLRRTFPPVFGRPEVVAHLRKHYWEPGNSVAWLEKVRRCTGRALSYDDLAAEMTQPLPDG